MIYTFMILDENNEEIDQAQSPIYLIHRLINNYGLDQFSIKQADSEKITAKIFMTGDFHNQPRKIEVPVTIIQTIQCGKINYKLVYYQIEGDEN